MDSFAVECDLNRSLHSFTTPLAVLVSIVYSQFDFRNCSMSDCPLQSDHPSSRLFPAFEFGFGFQYDEDAADHILIGPCYQILCLPLGIRIGILTVVP